MNKNRHVGMYGQKLFSQFALSLIVFFVLFTFEIYAKDEEAKVACKEGNFVVPPSQTPGPLIAFGENIYPKNTIVTYLAADDFIDDDQYFIDVVPSFVYAITDSLSIFLNVPFAAYKMGRHHSYGIEDIPIQFEYAYFNKIHSCSSDLATIVANVTIPSGSSNKQPPTGFGAPSYFIGTTYNHTTSTWLYCTSFGAVFPSSHNRTRFGNQYLYQFGIGRNIIGKNDWILTGMLELDGTFYERNKIHGKTNRNSGGNVIYVTPSIWISSQHVFFQFGFGFVAQEHLFGHQPKSRYLLATTLGRTF